MKKIISLILCIVLAACLLCSCAPEKSAAKIADKNTLNVVCTVFPIYDWARNIIGDAQGVELTLLIDNGVDVHSYQPSTRDIVTISSCDVFIYVGGESDEWITEALSQAENKDMIVINLMDVMGDRAKLEEAVNEFAEVDGDEQDEHIWLSIDNAIICCNAICDVMCGADEKNADTYKSNCEAYTEKLAVLDEEYRKVTQSAKRSVILVADRFPFRYLADDYGISYYAAFSGCDADSEASFETIMLLSDKTNELSLPAILIIDGSDSRLADTVIQTSGASDCDVYTLDSMQAVSAAEIKNGITYISVMEKNLNVLKKVLN